MAMERARYCDDSCPWYLCDSYTDSYGCVLFGADCRKNKQMEEDVCYVHPRRLQWLAYQANRQHRVLNRRINKRYSPRLKNPTTSKEYAEGHGYLVVYQGAGWIPTTYSRIYRPCRKGGHHHRRNYSQCSQCAKRLKRCHICDKPITKYEGYRSRFTGHICMECWKSECEEYAGMAGIPLDPNAFNFLRNPYIKIRRH